MTGPEPDPMPDLTAAQERAVRDLLAGARHDGSVPPAVAARLDAVLVDLVAERADGPAQGPAEPTEGASAPSAPSAPVVPLARRRRRIVGASLAAAAAVVVGGVAIGQVVGGGSSQDEASLAEDSAAGQQAPADALEEPRARRRPTAAQERLSADGAVPDLRRATLRRDVRALAPLAAAGGGLSDVQEPCRVGGPDGPGPGERVPVTYAGQDGLLVFRTPEGDEQRVDLYLCGSGDVARSVTLRLR